MWTVFTLFWHSKKQCCGRQWDSLPKFPIVLYAGQLVPEKRVVHLISTWPAIRSAVPDAMLIIAGSGSEADKLRATAGPGIRLIGEIPDVATSCNVRTRLCCRRSPKDYQALCWRPSLPACP